MRAKETRKAKTICLGLIIARESGISAFLWAETQRKVEECMSFIVGEREKICPDWRSLAWGSCKQLTRSRKSV